MCVCISVTQVHACMCICTLLHVLQIEKTAFHMAAEENSRECMKLLVQHFKVDPDEPDVVSCRINTMQ